MINNEKTSVQKHFRIVMEDRSFSFWSSNKIMFVRSLSYNPMILEQDNRGGCIKFQIKDNLKKTILNKALV